MDEPATPRPGHGTVFVMRDGETEWMASWQDDGASDCDDIVGSRSEVLAWARSWPAERWLLHDPGTDGYVPLPDTDDFEVAVPSRERRYFVSRPITSSSEGPGWFGSPPDAVADAALREARWTHVARVLTEEAARGEVEAWRSTRQGAHLSEEDVRFEVGHADYGEYCDLWLRLPG